VDIRPREGRVADGDGLQTWDEKTVENKQHAVTEFRKHLVKKTKKGGSGTAYLKSGPKKKKKRNAWREKTGEWKEKRPKPGIGAGRGQNVT